MKSVDFVAQKVGDCAPNMKLFPKRIAKAQYNVYGNVMEAMLKPFVNGVYGMMGNIVFVASQNYDPAMNVVQGLTWQNPNGKPKCVVISVVLSCLHRQQKRLLCVNGALLVKLSPNLK